MTRRLVLLAALSAAACSGGTSQLGTSVRQPVAVAFFDGRTTKWPGQVHRYLAVAAFAGNELRIVDPADDKAVIGPGLVFPLSVPTSPGPTFLAASGLGDAAPGGGPLPGLLAVAGQQAPAAVASPLTPALRIEVVATWSELTTVAPEALAVDLVAELQGTDPAVVDAQLISLVAIPVPGQPGRAALIAGLSGGRLAVVAYERDPASPVQALRRVPGLPARLVPARTATSAVPAGIPFDPLALALGPEPDGLFPPVDPPGTRRIFAATGDALGDVNGKGVRGVVQITAAFAADGSPAGWRMVGLDARGPTRLVAAQLVSERDMTVDPPAPEKLTGTMALRVFAMLDERGCGPRAAIDCGVVTLVPDDPSRGGGIAADPVGELPYRAPMRVPGYPLAMTAAAPRAAGDASVSGNGPTADPRFRVMNIAPGTGQRDASAVLAVTSADGKVYLFDVSRWGAGNDVSQLRGTSYAGVASSGLFGPGLPVANAPDPSQVSSPPLNKNYPVLTVWQDYTTPRPPDGQPWTAVTKAIHREGNLPKSIEPSVVEANVKAPPGYAQNDTWSIRWRGAMPALAGRLGQLGQDAGGVWVAAQQTGFDGRGSPVPVPWLGIIEPELGVHLGDIVDLDLGRTDVCANAPLDALGQPIAGRVRALVTAFLPASPAYPGGALQILPAPSCPGGVFAAANPIDARITVRAQGFVLVGSAFGYGGRPAVSGTMVEDAPTEADKPTSQATIDAQMFFLRWEDEQALQAQIAAAPDAATLRALQERLAIARKARRNFYPADEVCGAGSTIATDLACAQWNPGWDPTSGRQAPIGTPPPAAQPPDRYVLRFRLAVFCRGTTPATVCEPVDRMREDTGLVFASRRGVAEWNRRPPSGGSFPRALGWIDRSVYDPGFVTQIVAGFSDDQVIDFSPGSAGTVTAVVR